MATRKITTKGLRITWRKLLKISIDELDIEELIKKERENDTKECCHKCFIPLMEHRRTNWDMLTQTSKLTCPECGLFKKL